jgi:hypothetical protein
VSIDGDLGEWAELPWQSTGDDDLQVSFLVGHDDGGLTLAIRIVDDAPRRPEPGASLAEKLNADHIELWLFDPSVRKPERCTEWWKGICVGETVAAETFAMPEATRHIGVFPTGALHLPDGKVPAVDGQQVASAWRDGPEGHAHIEVRIPRDALPYVDGVDIPSIGIVLDVFDNDSGAARQEAVLSSSPGHGWWKLSGPEVTLPSPWKRNPAIRTALAEVDAGIVAPPTVAPGVVCTFAFDTTLRCAPQPEPSPGPFNPIATVTVARYGGSSVWTYAGIGDEVVTLSGDIVWRGRVDGDACVSTYAEDPSGCYGAGCGAPSISMEVVCRHDGQIVRARLPYDQPIEGEVCDAPSAAYASADQADRAEANAHWTDDEALLRFDGPSRTITVEARCVPGSQGRTTTRRLLVQPGDPKLVQPR